jgi:hypothetical protein
MVDHSRVYFPLRSNAYTLLAGRQIAALRARIKRAALLNDEVILESGTFDVQAGPGGSFSTWRPPTGKEKWQTPSLRGRLERSTFTISMKPSAAPADAPAHPIIQSPASIVWIATLEPLKRELPRGLKWLRYGHGDDLPEVAREAGSIFNPDYKDEALAALFPEGFVRTEIIKQFNLDLGMAASIEAAVTFDKRHAAVVQARVARGDADWVLGDRALALILSEEPTWEEVNELRRSKGFQDYRAILRDAEAAAMETAAAGVFDHRLLNEYGDALEKAASKRPSTKAKAAVALLSSGAGIAASIATGGAMLVGEAISFAIGTLGGEVADRLATPSWLSMHRGIRRLPQRRRAIRDE